MGQSIVSPWIYYIPQAITNITPPIPPAVKTRLGLVGETLIGPAFQPTLVKTRTQFTNIFGERDPELDGITKFPRYELPYIANSFLNYSQGLFVTRVLGFSGYDAGHAWGITLVANYDYTTIGPTVTGRSYNTLFSFTADSQGVLTNIVTTDPLIKKLWDNNLLSNSFNNLPGSLSAATDSNNTGGTLNSISSTMYELNSTYTGLSISNFYLKAYNYDLVTDTYIGSTSGITDYYSASTFSNVNNQLVALLRSRGNYSGDEQLNFKLSGGTTSIDFDAVVSGSSTYVYSDFKLNWTNDVGTTGSTILSFDKNSVNYIVNVLGRTNDDRLEPFYVEDIYDNIIRTLNVSGKVRGLKLSLVEYGDSYSNYKEKYQPSVTPWVVSQVKGSNISKLFRFWSKGDGVYTSNLFKVTISNINPSDSLNTGYTADYPDEYPDYKFDVTIRPIDNPDNSFQAFADEIFTTCSMNPKSVDYIGKKIGTRNGDYPSNSNYVTVEINEDDETIPLTFPAGFLGYPIRDYENTQSGTAIRPYNLYKTTYETNDNVPTTYLGLSDALGYDKDMFKYQGLPNSTTLFQWTGMTKSFHMDINATGSTVDDTKVTVDGVNYFYYDYEFEAGPDVFDDVQNLNGTQYFNVDSRKFSFMAYGGFDGWDMYRAGRTNSNRYKLTGDLGILGETSGSFKKIALSDKNNGLTSDYYAFLEGVWTFKNSDFININLFATPGLDVINHNDLIEATVDMIEFDRADSLYIVTTPDVDAANNMLTAQDVVDYIDSTFDTTYAATYWPWVKISDGNSDANIFLPPTISVLTNMAKNDSTQGIQLWDATAGISRGDISVLNIRQNESLQYLSKTDVDFLYNNRINPILKIDLYQDPVIYTGFKIWGNKTLSTTNYLTNRVNVRRLMLEIRSLMIATCRKYLFEPNDNLVRREIEKAIIPLLVQLKDNHGISQYKLVFDTTPEMIDKGYLSAKIYLKPIKALEYIVFAFTKTPTEAGFEIEFNQE